MPASRPRRTRRPRWRPSGRTPPACPSMRSSSAAAVETDAGLVPAGGAVGTSGLDVSDEQMEELLAVDVEELAASVPQIHEHSARFGDRLPQELREQLAKLEERLGK